MLAAMMPDPRGRSKVGSGAVAVRALVFDVFGTLVDWRSGISEAFRGAGLPDPDHLADAWRAKYPVILAEVNAGARRWGDLDEMHSATLDELLGERGIDLSVGSRRQLVEAWHQLDPWRDVRTGLETLRRQVITATLSNAHIALLVDLARHGDLRFDCVLSAELAGAYKPAPEAYLTAARLLGVAPGELMLVAAHPSDLAGARAVGLATAFIDRPLEYGPGSPSRADPDADASIAQLQELTVQVR
jgi:2-haloacid dehalogenase